MIWKDLLNKFYDFLKKTLELNKSHNIKRAIIQLLICLIVFLLLNFLLLKLTYGVWTDSENPIKPDNMKMAKKINRDEV